ncbi:MAG TPA: ABC transporter ATP-binding protein [Acidimicrobiia bacterium]|nr:ABC transporter ATP-binding protein [Acidimicrobiia bacterium]
MLRLSGIHAGYGRVGVLRGVDLVVPAGSVVALLGANGAGKTTLLKVAAGLLAPTQGTVALGGTTIERLTPSRRVGRGLCLIPEGRGIFRRLTVRQNIAMFVGGRDVETAVERAAEMFPKLGSRLTQTAGTMSGGEQQMLAVVRALVTDPAVVLADELSIGLAPVVCDEIFNAVAALRAEGRSLLVVEQYVDRVLGLSDYVYVLHKGEVAFVGVPAQCGPDLFERYLGGAA